MAAWTKNEGLLFVVVILLARAAAWGRRAFSANFIKQLAWLATGLAAVLVVVVCFKVIVAPANDLLAGQSLPVAFARLTTFARWTTVGTAFGREYFSVGKILAWVLPLYLVLVGLRPGAFRERGTRTIWLTLGGMLLGYWMAYVLTPHPLDWHLNSSAGRLLIQLWPALVAGTFLSTPSQS
ncbi:MAG TPA: hypothetical protein VGX76_15780, partial [Pirellulales bacterium]|nr:hypothetical protein [Pirellulales bacterium]